MYSQRYNQKGNVQTMQQKAAREEKHKSKMWYLGVDACMTVLCLRKTQCDEENSAVGSGAGKKQGEMGMVMFCGSVVCDAMEINEADESSAGRSMAKWVWRCPVSPENAMP
jgi:hypothetical protein